MDDRVRMCRLSVGMRHSALAILHVSPLSVGAKRETQEKAYLILD